MAVGGAARVQDVLGTIWVCRNLRPTVMWSSISMSGSELTLVKALDSVSLSHFINDTKGASHHQDAALADRRVYDAAGVR